MSDRFIGGGVIADATSISIPVLLRRSSNNNELTGIAYTSVTAYYWRQGGTLTTISVVALGSINAAYSSGGWYQLSATSAPGVYRLDIPDAAFASGADWVEIIIKVSTAYTVYQGFVLNSKSAVDVYTNLTAAMAELAQGVPPTNPTIAEALMLLYMTLRNKTTTTASELAIFNDAATKIAKAALSDDATTFTRDKLASGA